MCLRPSPSFRGSNSTTVIVEYVLIIGLLASVSLVLTGGLPQMAVAFKNK